MLSKNNMFNLGFTKSEYNEIEQNKISYSKQMSSFMKKCRTDSKLSTCFFCDTACSSFCNSHTIPRFCLKSISKDGWLFYANTLIKMPLSDSEKGINAAGTFQIICNDCDSKIFSEYENPDNYNILPSGKMLSQIALKNYLKMISKRLLEISMFDNAIKQFGQSPELSHMLLLSKSDLRIYLSHYSYAKKATTQTKWNDSYYLAFYKKLNYIVPIAFQGSITLIADFNDSVINNIYGWEDNPDFQFNDIHVCVFPLESYSVIMMFCRNGEKKYSQFFKQFNKLSEDEKLKAINFIIFSYSEDVFIYKGVDSGLLNDIKLQEEMKQTNHSLALPHIDPLKAAIQASNLSKMHSIPNFLDEKNKVK